MRNLAKTAFVLALSTAALSAVAAPASALVVASGVHVGNFLFTPPGVFVQINGTNTTVPFTLPAPARVAITFSAECAVDSPNLDTKQAWVDIDIVVDGVAVVPPTAGNADTFCTHHGPGFDEWTHPSVTVVKSLSAGAHSVAVFGRPNGTATGGWIGDSSTVIER